MMMRAKFLQLMMLALSFYSLRVDTEGGFLVGKQQQQQQVRCSVEEREALLNFKHSLFDSQNLLHTWESYEDCCTWKGVGCSNTTDHVIDINFSWGDSYLGWPLSATSIDSSLFRLKHLQNLSLRGIYFHSASIPPDIGSLTSLRHLDLSWSGFSGVIPPHLGNLTNLRFLELGDNNLAASSLLWASRLFSLQYLDMSYVDLTLAINWLHEIKMLPALSTLKLFDCKLRTLPTLLPYCNFSSAINMFDLSNNQFPNSTIPSWLSNMTNLVELHLSGCQLLGVIPNNFLGALCRLTKLDLSYNLIDGSISSMVLGPFPRCTTGYELKYLDLSNNRLSGSFPIWLEQLTSLNELDFESNNFTRPISWVTLSLLCDLDTLILTGNSFTELIDGKSALRCKEYKIRYMDISWNQLSGSIPEWVGQMRQLRYLNLERNQLNGSIPQSLGQLMNLNYLNLATNLLQGSLSDVNFANLSQLEALYLSNNQVNFNMISTNWVPPFQIQKLYIDSCKIGPHFPAWLQTQKHLTELEIFNTSISDMIPNWFWNITSQVSFLDMSYNAIRGELPNSLSLSNEAVIDLRSNLLEGHLPQLTNSVFYAFFSDNKFSNGISRYLNANMSGLEILDLYRNQLSDEIPSSICQMPSIRLLDLSYNKLSGEIPRCQWNISSFKMLNFINFQDNNLWGSIAQWIGNIPRLLTLYMSNNNLQGDISFLKNCSSIITLDLGENELTGNIPLWIGDKLSSLKILRLRSNKFYGSIPSNISKLKALQILDLANNSLTGQLPKSFRYLKSMTILNKSLESLIPEDEIFFLNIYLPSSYVMIIDINRAITIPDSSMIDTKEAITDSLMIDIQGAMRRFTDLSLEMIMDLSCNNLTGEVPIELMSLIGLRSLNLSMNEFTGHIPINIGIMKSLESLDLSKNHFSGEIPQSIVNLNSLSYLNLSYNQLSGKIPTATQLDTFNESSYYGNPNLCGEPLLKTCHNGESNSDVDDDADDDVDDDETFGLFLGMGLGFAVGLWSVLGILLLKRSWAIAYFKFYDNIANNIYVFIMIKKNRWFNR